METIQIKVERFDHDSVILHGENALFNYNPNTKNGEALDDFISSCKGISDTTATLKAENKELREFLKKISIYHDRRGEIYKELQELLNKER